MPNPELRGAFDRGIARRRVEQRLWRVDPGLVAGLHRVIAGRTAFDFGAGIGLYCEALSCGGVDGIPGVEQLSHGRVAFGNLADPELVVPAHAVALCLEVGEHIPRSHEGVLLAHLTRQCRTLILSWAAPGQPGEGHVNCRSLAEVVQLLGERGFGLDRDASDMLRRSARISWFRKNIAVYQRLLPESDSGESPGH